jgi:vacuolar-type H+-ATPase subunit E/Vma4
MLHQAANAVEDIYRDRKEELEEIEYTARTEARRRAQVINESRNGFLMI